MSDNFTAAPKTPAEVKRTALDWTDWLDTGETIISYTVTSSDEAFDVDQAAEVAGVISWRVSGGTLRTRPRVTVQITTSTGRIEEASVQYWIRSI